MTKLGKLLVLLNLPLGLIMAAWAFGVYTNRIDFSDKKDKDSVGELAQRKDALKKHSDARVLAEERLNGVLNGDKAGTQGLLALEKIQPENRQWYDQQLQELVNSPNPVNRLRRDQGGKLAVDLATGRPQLVPDAALHSKATYEQMLQDTATSINTVQVKIKGLISQTAALTEQLNGANGLRFQIARELGKQGKLIAEQDNLRPILINTAVEAEKLLARLKALDERLKELAARAIESK